MSETAPSASGQLHMGPDASIFSGPAVPAGRQAIVYFPGLGTRTDEGVDAVAHRIAIALDNNQADPGVSFAAHPGAVFKYDGGATAAATIVRRREGYEDTPVLDVYEMDYRPFLTGAFEAGSPLYKVFQLMLALLANAGMMRGAFRGGQSFRQKLQVWYAALIAMLMVAYVVMLIAAGISVMAPALRKVEGAFAPHRAVTVADTSGKADTARVAAAKPRWPARGRGAVRADWRAAPFRSLGDTLGYGVAVALMLLRDSAVFLRDGARIGILAAAGWIGRKAGTLRQIVLAMTAGGLLSRWSLKDMVQRTATLCACTAHYLSFGEHRNAILGHLARLLDSIRSRKDVEYAAVHLAGYSFGSVVALDALFQDSPANRKFDGLVSVTTVGCPADFIRTFHRDSFVDRYPPPAQVQWVNVYSPADVLASNFVTGRTAAAVMSQGDIASVVAAEKGPAAELPARTAQSRHALNGAVRLRGTGEPAQLLRLPDLHIEFGAGPVGRLKSIAYFLRGGGFTAHTCYWGPGASYDKTCWEEIVQKAGIFAAVEHAPAAKPLPPPAGGAPALAEGPASAPVDDEEPVPR
jgi:hypothetical protein